MTVRNTNYSSLEEVWGDTTSVERTKSAERSTKRKDKKDRRERQESVKIVDPICELYEMGNYRGYTENDIVNYANEYHDRYFEKGGTRPNEKVVRNYDDDNDMYQQTEDDEPRPPINKHTVRSIPKRKYVVDDEDIQPSSRQVNEFAFIDLLLYIISGVILIFVMEQFVKIGILLQ